MPIYSLDGHTPELPAADNFWVAPGAHIIGKVRLGKDVGIWFGVVLRGDNELLDIGAETNIQEGCTLHADMGFPLTIGKGCTIGHNAIVHGCVIGDNSLIGMGAIILNGATIGKNCLVGAGAVITEGKSYPDNSLIVGAPAKAIRTLDENVAARLRETATNYVKNWKRFSRGMVEI